MGRIAVSILAAGVMAAFFAPAVHAQTAGQPGVTAEGQRSPAVRPAQRPQTARPTTGEQRRRATAPQANRAPNAQGQPQRPPAQAGGTPQQRQAGANQGGNLNLDLSRGGSTQGGARRHGDAFATSGPYATPAQMERFTGRRQVRMPQAPSINVFGNQDQSQGPAWVPR